MRPITPLNSRLFLQLAILAILVVFMFFLWEGNQGFELGDEGFLWYGVQRVIKGEVPIRDFMAYDPGRYYWSATLLGLWGDHGIIALRASVAIFQVLGLFTGLWLIACSVKKANFFYLLLSALTLAVWMFPRYKLFDISLSILLIGALTFLVESPTSRRYFFAGLCVGLVAVFGRNHGMYGVAGSLGVMLWLCIKREEGTGFVKGLALWGAGVFVGFIPIFLMLLFVPGFAAAFWVSIRFLFEVKTTNISIPIPFPWRVSFSTLPLSDAIRGVLVGLFFIALPVFGVLSVIWVVRQKYLKRPVPSALVAASFLALPYTHYAYSRAGVYHLAQGIFPFLIGIFVLLAIQPSKVKWPLAFLLCGVSFWVTSVYHPYWLCYRNPQCEVVEISGNSLHLASGTAKDVALIRQLSDEYAQNGGSFIATPFWPGAYALMERKSPLWEIFALYPRSQAFQLTEIERIKTAKPGFAIVLDIPLDGREELRYRNTHPLIQQYITDNFELLPNTPNPAYGIYKIKTDNNNGVK